jgi:hypothetical protein
MKEALLWLIDLLATVVAGFIGYVAADALGRPAPVGAIVAGALVLLYGSRCYFMGLAEGERT